MLSSSRGFALIEALVVLGLIGILLTIGYPYYQVFMQNASYRSAAREVASVMRQARAEAATRNREHRVEIDLKGSDQRYRYRLSRGDRSRNSSAWMPSEDEAKGWNFLSPLIAIDVVNADQCRKENGILYLNFFPDGTASCTAEIHIENRAGERRFLVQLTSRATGHVTVGR
ncbi:GspH/FimT family pseudopilin [Geoalkalibacter halelectricus]|uniref:Type II secretion system protein H n=1 Tax=Geoalkalibacter halelectricus TaxID=2847045 RepID=A0ABY5ZKB2_9BACT|nr:GspH/FimT family pseudopilin [Geoalkalibacter halelectricus]MDO3376796.1 GspH/FimT family pseudopilin [Geoalkalibacter halelectricus]UWZ79561.1 GspH/FimT family pseudopilin [Geoalkalibacter halelectricus]